MTDAERAQALLDDLWCYEVCDHKQPRHAADVEKVTAAFATVREEGRQELAELQQALGLLTTLAPTMEMDAAHPLAMAHEIVRQAEAERDRLRDAAEYLWAVVANVSGGDWQEQTRQWQRAAAKARDQYHAALAPRPGEEEK